MAPQPLVEVDPRTLREMRAFLRAASTAERKETRRLGQLHKALAVDVAADAQAQARRMGGVQAKAAAAITGQATQSHARIGIGRPGRFPMAPPAFWGAEKRTGWNARNPGSEPQHPEWVGNRWEVGGAGGPYAINDVLRRDREAIAGRYSDLFDVLARDVGFT